MSSLDPDNHDNDIIAEKYPLVYYHSRNYAARLIQKSWNRFMIRTVYKYLYQCAKEFSDSLNPKELSRIYPEFLESSDPRMTYKLAIKMQGESFPPCLVCRIISESAPSIDGGRHAPKWIPLFNAGNNVPIDQKALVHLFLEALHVLKPQQTVDQTSSFNSVSQKTIKDASKKNNQAQNGKEKESSRSKKSQVEDENDNLTTKKNKKEMQDSQNLAKTTNNVNETKKKKESGRNESLSARSLKDSENKKKERL